LIVGAYCYTKVVVHVQIDMYLHERKNIFTLKSLFGGTWNMYIDQSEIEC